MSRSCPDCGNTRTFELVEEVVEEELVEEELVEEELVEEVDEYVEGDELIGIDNFDEVNKKQYYHCLDCGTNIADRKLFRKCPSCDGNNFLNLDNPPQGYKPTFKSYYKCFDCKELKVHKDLTLDILTARREMIGNFTKCSKCEGTMRLLYDWYDHLEQRHEQEMDEFYNKQEIEIDGETIMTSYGGLNVLEKYVDAVIEMRNAEETKDYVSISNKRTLHKKTIKGLFKDYWERLSFRQSYQ